jgi:4-hydroxybenzoate polyprenyltransferase
MAACRGLDVLLGAGAGRLRAAAPAAAALAVHTAGVTVLSRGEVHGSTRGAAGAVAAGSVAVAAGALAGLRPDRSSAGGRLRLPTGGGQRGVPARVATAGVRTGRVPTALATVLATGAYLATCLPAQLTAAATPDGPAARAATGAGIRAMVPVQAAWAARAGRPGPAAVLGVVGLAGTLLRRRAGARAVSET